MLTLTARVNDPPIDVSFGGTTLTIQVTEIHGGWVRLGFQAPQQVKIERRNRASRAGDRATLTDD